MIKWFVGAHSDGTFRWCCFVYWFLFRVRTQRKLKTLWSLFTPLETRHGRCWWFNCKFNIFHRNIHYFRSNNWFFFLPPRGIRYVFPSKFVWAENWCRMPTDVCVDMRTFWSLIKKKNLSTIAEIAGENKRRCPQHRTFVPLYIYIPCQIAWIANTYHWTVGWLLHRSPYNTFCSIHVFRLSPFSAIVYLTIVWSCVHGGSG